MNGVRSNGISPVARSIGRQHGLAELHDAARAPRQHLLGLRLRQLVDGVVGETPERVDVAGAKLARCRSNGSARP